MQQFYLGFRHFINATAFLSKHKLLHYYLYPLLLSIAFYMGITAFTIRFAEDITNHIVYLRLPIPEIRMQSAFQSFFKSDFITGLVSIVVGLIVFYIASKISKYLVLIMLSPLFAYLSEIVEEKITGVVYPFNFIQFLKDILRGIKIAFRNFILEFVLIGLFTIAGFFVGPFALLIVPFLWLISTYFYGFSMIDYTCERRKLTVAKSVEFIRQHRYLAIANGSAYTLLEMLPIVGLMIAPINAVVGATTAVLELEAKTTKTHHLS